MKNNKLKITTIIFLAFFAFIITGCFDPIYHTIRQDVKPEKPTVSGDAINSIARYKVDDIEYLALAADGGLRYKKADNTTHGSWSTFSNLPFELPHDVFETNQIAGESIIKVLADKDYIYLVSVEYNNHIPTNPKIWAGKMKAGFELDGEWQKVNLGTNKLEIGTTSKFNIFSTNDYVAENRKVYLRVGNDKDAKYFNIDGKDLKETTPLLGDKANDSLESSLNSVVYYGGEYYFFNSDVAIVNNDRKYIYYGDGEKLYYGKPTDKFETKLTVKAPIASLATTADSIIIGCGKDGKNGGIKRTSLTPDGIPGTELLGFKTNAADQIPSYYSVPYLLNATPSKTELESNLYATVTFTGIGTGNSKFKDRGLWSYYPSRSNWNRE